MPQFRRTMCNRDCPDACGIVATIHDGRVLRLQGDREHPVTRGFLCFRTNQFLRTQYSESRVTRPLIRRDGALEPATWDEALDLIAARLLKIRTESGPEAIFHYRSGGTLGLLTAEASEVFFEAFGPVTVKRGDICSGAGEAAQKLDFGESDSSDLEDLLLAKNILVWGKNVFTSSPHTIPVLKQARARGAHLVLIDPVHHQTASLCHRVIQPRPGGDFALAMAVAHLMFERRWVHEHATQWCDNLAEFETMCRQRGVAEWCDAADVDERDVIALAERLRTIPTSILVGWGMARRRNGGAIVRALDALAAISGNVGLPGACVSYYFRRRLAFRQIHRGLEVAPRSIPEPLFGRAVLDAEPAIRAVWITAGNPVAMLPDSLTVASALRTRELVVVADSWLSDSAALAHIVLPTPTLLEADDILGAYGHHHIGAAQPVVTAPPDVRSELQIFQALAQRVGLNAAMSGDALSWKKRVLSPDLPADASVERLSQGSLRNPLAPRVVFDGRRFSTPNGRARLLTKAPETPCQDPAFPLWLMSLSTPQSQSSQWAKGPPMVAVVTVHPDAAGDVADGELARLRSRLGALTVRVRHDPLQRRDVAVIAKGGHLRDGACANAITRAALTDIGEGGALYDERVLLEPYQQP